MRCLICGSATEVVYEQSGAPVHAVRLIPNREAALSTPRGDIRLVFCRACGFARNAAFDASLTFYDEDYNPTQAHSGTFNKFQETLAKGLIEEFHLRDKTILEIGCGGGEFLDLFRHAGNNRVIGMDPSCGRKSEGDFTVIPEFFPAAKRLPNADFILCKMTLEHVAQPDQFLAELSTQGQNHARLFFMVPDSERIFREGAFWDLYYEHCNYFSETSLRILLSRFGFRVTKLWRDFGGQYLLLTAEPDEKKTPFPKAQNESGAKTKMLSEKIHEWGKILREGKSSALWGGGSKAVAFTQTLKPGASLLAVIDIDPLKQGTFLAGSGLAILAPNALKDLKPERVIIMNPIYRREIESMIHGMGLRPQILCCE